MRYFFHLRQSQGYVIDDEGVELADGDAVLAAATIGARSIIAGEAMDGRLPLLSIIEVDDENGLRVLDLPFREAVLLECE
ncbi:MAG: hypothetical protein AVDCRST_MAG23-1738 [uncultured Sphingosinicella sp.]|uniref:DUF6894 domain-containing protein n=1 Tax=uncultured Sphingosinicella sp. TaxID=478748 RepID=A0A6J4U2D7_9SPHN|nr:hypothetical protein [uncultured Sphingosinicella sp.]CAA9538991.1 MAG: hypothetical protein AVDCRST_MAG23-1738 [uncultured Sphingosinicella sp.]